MKNWSTERLLSITAMTVSLFTLIIFIYQTNLMRQQNYISILPYLQVSSTSNEGEFIFDVNIINQGVGPAIFESAYISYQGDRYDFSDYGYDFYEVLSAVEPTFDSLRYYSSTVLDPGIAISPGERFNLFAVRNVPEEYGIVAQTFDRMLSEGLYYRIVYRSIQNERWEITADSNGPKKLR